MTYNPQHTFTPAFTGVGLPGQIPSFVPVFLMYLSVYLLSHCHHIMLICIRTISHVWGVAIQSFNTKTKSGSCHLIILGSSINTRCMTTYPWLILLNFISVLHGDLSQRLNLHTSKTSICLQIYHPLNILKLICLDWFEEVILLPQNHDLLMVLWI